MKRFDAISWRIGLVGLILPSIVVWATDFVRGAPTNDKTERPVPEARLSLDLFKTWNFDQQAGGQAPAGFSAFTVGDHGTPSWVVQHDAGALSTPNLLRPSSACAAQTCFEVLLVDALRYEYLDLIVRVRLSDPSADSNGAAGVVFGARDRANFYAVTVDAFGRRIEVLRVEQGTPTTLARADIAPKKVDWHLMRVRRNTIISKEYIEVFFDNAQVFSVEDNTFKAGQIGLVARGPAAVEFDNLTAAPLYSQRPLSGPAAY